MQLKTSKFTTDSVSMFPLESSTLFTIQTGKHAATVLLRMANQMLMTSSKYSIAVITVQLKTLLKMLEFQAGISMNTSVQHGKENGSLTKLI